MKKIKTWLCSHVGVNRDIEHPYLHAGPEDKQSLSFCKWLILASIQTSVSQLER